MTQPIESQTRGETIVVVPCYNEARRLDIGAFDYFLEQFAGISLLLVDDGSSDDTPRLLEELRARHAQQVSVLRLCVNVGKAEAVRRGVQLAVRRRPAMVGYWDADLATPLESIARFETVLRERPELMLVMGSRVALLGRQIRRRYVRHLIGRAFATAASLVLRMPVYDTQCGAKLFRVTPDIVELFRQPFRTRWIFDVEILARMTAAGGGGWGNALGKWSGALPQPPPTNDRTAQELIYEYPLDEWRDVGGSRLTLVDFMVAALDLAAIGWRYSLRRPAWVARPESSMGVAEHESSTHHAHRQTLGPANHRDAA